MPRRDLSPADGADLLVIGRASPAKGPCQTEHGSVTEGHELLEYTKDAYVAKGTGIAKVYFFVRGLYCDGAYATITIR